MILTANGFFVTLLVSLIASRKASGEGWVRAVMIPKPPAFDMEAARNGSPACCIPPCTTGTRMPRIFVSSVTSGIVVDETKNDRAVGNS